MYRNGQKRVRANYAMGSEETRLPSPSSFAFPFTPYSIQTEFMRALFSVVEQGGLGVLESPTGTGKTMSIICAALTWLNMHEQRRQRDLQQEVRQDQTQDEDDDDNEDWLAKAARAKERRERMAEAKRELEFITTREERLKELRLRRKTLLRNDAQLKQQFHQLFPNIKDNAIREQNERGDKSRMDEDEENVSDDECYADYESSDDEPEEEEEDTSHYVHRVFFASRTHSQLSQFIKEVQRSPFASDVRLVSLASRAHLCVNPEVNKLSSNTLINEICLELQRSKSKNSGKSCPYKGRTSGLADQALLQVQDIEELVKKGKNSKACPYYASRQALQDAQIVVLPYNLLLHQSTREAIKLSLKNSVVIIDEAHNLIETIVNMHSVEVSALQILTALSQLQAYLDRFEARLKAKHLLYLKQMKFLLTNMLRMLGGVFDKRQVSDSFTDQSSEVKSELIEPYLLMRELGLFKIDGTKLLKYATKSKLAHKLPHAFKRRALQKPTKEKKSGLQAFLEKQQGAKPIDKQDEAQKVETTTKIGLVNTSNALLTICEFISTLLCLKATKVLISNPNGNLSRCKIKLCLLSPSSPFKTLVDECRAVVLAGGTMRPLAEFEQQLFLASGAPQTRIHNFVCGHVVSKQNVLPLVLKCGPTRRQLDFSFSQRDAATKDELFRVLVNLCAIVPGGVICFFPSYDFEKSVHEYLVQRDLLPRLTKKKKLFREPKKNLEQVLNQYATAAKSPSGALLFSVVGGKMSEGINFNDELGRCVVMVGLPFPNANDIELKEKMRYLDENSGPNSGKVHYHNLCMKAVNQCIGRCIRHKDDYASIILLDHRYERKNILDTLPTWIGESVQVLDNFPALVQNVTRFFKARKKTAE